MVGLKGQDLGGDLLVLWSVNSQMLLVMQAVVEGLARIVSLMPLAEAQQAAIQLVLPIVRKAQSLVSNEEAGRTPEQADAMANELQLIASAVR